ncbi:hypothetical protein D3C81_333470 [compost metagenome]
MWMLKRNDQRYGTGYYQTNLEQIVESWNKGIKFVRVHYDHNRYMELQIYNSSIFTREAPQYDGCVILDRFQVKFVTETMDSPAFKIAQKKIKAYKKLNRGNLKLKNWVDKEEFIQLLKDIEELVLNTDSYRTADILCGDYNPNAMNMYA